MTDYQATSSNNVETRLKGNMGTVALMLTVLAFAAPIAVVTSFIPITFIFGGVGSVSAIIITMALVLFFAVGFVTMTKHVRRPGAFYSYVTAGLGKTPGLGGAFLTAASYYMVLIGGYALTGVLASQMIASFGGPAIPWWVAGGLAWAAVSILGYYHIDLSAKILIAAMVFEIALIVVFDVWTLIDGGADGLSVEPFKTSSITSGDLPITMLFCTLMFLGFEATAVFRDEVRAPSITIPRATYGAVIFVGIVHAVSAYCLITVFGSSEAMALAKAQPTEMFPRAIGSMISPIFVQITTSIVVISQFASTISVHNVTSRYVQTLAADGALPKYFARVHGKHNSPHRASVLVASLAALALVPYIYSNSAPDLLYGQLMGIGLVGLMLLMAMVSLSVMIWFMKNGRPKGVTIFHVYICPAIAFLGIGSAAIMAFSRFDVVFGGSVAQNKIFFAIIAGAFLLGILSATYFRLFNKSTYAALGGALRNDEESIENQEEAAIDATTAKSKAMTQTA